MSNKNKENEKLYLHEMNRANVEELLKTSPRPVVLVAVGSLEQHGPHLALGRDCYGAKDICERVARKTRSIIVHPTWLGYSEHHMGFKGTITLSWTTLLNVLVDTVKSLSSHGFKKIMFINNHGGNSPVIGLAVMIGRKETESIVVTEPAFEASAPSVKEKRKKYLDIHAGSTETGRMLAARPELVDMERLENLAWGQPKIPDELLKLLNDPSDRYGFGFQIAKSYLPETHKFTSSGIYGLCDPREINLDAAKEEIEERVERILRYIEIWQTVPDELVWPKLTEHDGRTG